MVFLIFIVYCHDCLCSCYLTIPSLRLFLLLAIVTVNLSHDCKHDLDFHIIIVIVVMWMLLCEFGAVDLYCLLLWLLGVTSYHPFFETILIVGDNAVNLSCDCKHDLLLHHHLLLLLHKYFHVNLALEHHCYTTFGRSFDSSSVSLDEVINAFWLREKHV